MSSEIVRACEGKMEDNDFTDFRCRKQCLRLHDRRFKDQFFLEKFGENWAQLSILENPGTCVRKTGEIGGSEWESNPPTTG
jgi:hypothetical protein